MSSYDSKLPPFMPTADPAPNPAPDGAPFPIFSLPDRVPPDGPVIDVPPVEVLPHTENPELPEPDEGGEERDFPLPPEPEIEFNAVDAGSNQTVAAADNPGEADSGDDAAGNQADTGGDSGGNDGGGDAGEGGGGDGGGDAG